MDELLKRHRQQILALARQNGISNVRVFGSRARNQARPDSDLDLLVEMEQGRSGFALGGFQADVSELLRLKVDVITENALHPGIRYKILREARPL